MGTFNNPSHVSTNLRRFYPDGRLENWVNPIYPRAQAPRGTYFTRPSDARKTMADPAPGPGKQNERQGRGYADDVTGNPWGSQDSEIWKQSGSALSGPARPEVAHDASPDITADPANKYAKSAYKMDFESLKKLSGDVWAQSPVAAIFFALAGIILANEILLREPRINRAGTGVGRATARQGQIITGAGTGAAAAVAGEGIEAVNKTVENAVDAVESIGG